MPKPCSDLWDTPCVPVWSETRFPGPFAGGPIPVYHRAARGDRHAMRADTRKEAIAGPCAFTHILILHNPFPSKHLPSFRPSTITSSTPTNCKEIRHSACKHPVAFLYTPHNLFSLNTLLCKLFRHSLLSSIFPPFPTILNPSLPASYTAVGLRVCLV